MAESAGAPVTRSKATAIAPLEARKSAIRASRDRVSGNLDALEERVRTAVGIRARDASASPGARRAETAVGVFVTARRLWRLPFWRLTAIGAVTAGFVLLGASRSRRHESPSDSISPS